MNASKRDVQNMDDLAEIKFLITKTNILIGKEMCQPVQNYL